MTIYKKNYKSDSKRKKTLAEKWQVFSVPDLGGVINNYKMVKYKKVFLKFWNLNEFDFIPCSLDGTKAVDIHHLVFRSQQGKDTPDNLIPLCRNCHNRAHESTFFNSVLKIIHKMNIKKYVANSNSFDYESFIINQIELQKDVIDEALS